MTELPDRLLRDALRDEASRTLSPTCVDTDSLAAWADGTMTDAGRAAIESHAASCARCLALLAAMTRTEPLPMAPPWWRRSPIAWLLPLAAATAALVIVVGLAVIERHSPAPAAVASSSTGVARPSPPAVSAPQAAGASAQPSAPAVSTTSAALRRREHSRTDAAPSAALAAARSREQDAAAPPASMTPTAAPTSAPAAPSAAPAAPSAVTRDEMAGGRGGGGGGRGFAAQGGMKAAAQAPAPILIASPDRGSQWRIVAGTVEHTADGGATWQPQPIGVATPMLAGAAPDARVCWVVGVAGAVVRTTDGTTWTRVPFPESVDLVAIHASDASHAAVTTAAGRRFTTSDGGMTWIAQGHL